MRKMKRFAYAAALLVAFILPGHEMLFNVAESVAAQTISGLIYTSPVVVGGSFNYNGGPQSSAVKANGGTFIANGSTAVTVTNANVTANSVIIFGVKTVGGTPAGAPFIATVTPGTGFTVKAAVGDTSTYNYWILG
jgi:hypothetical protein